MPSNAMQSACLFTSFTISRTSASCTTGIQFLMLLSEGTRYTVYLLMSGARPCAAASGIPAVGNGRTTSTLSTQHTRTWVRMEQWGRREEEGGGQRHLNV